MYILNSVLSLCIAHLCQHLLYCMPTCIPPWWWYCRGWNM